MKNIVKFGALSLVLALGGCNFFDNSSPSTSSPEVIFSSVRYTEGSLAAVYELFGEERSYRNRLACGFAGLNTDIEYNRNSSSNKKEYPSYQIKPSDSDLSDFKGRDPWGYLNTIIERCNNIVQGIDKYGYPSTTNKKDSAQFDYLKGEALFLRAFAQLEKVKYWGDVPLSIIPFDGFDVSTLAVTKVDRNESFEQIRKDLKEAANLMEWSASAQVTIAQNDVRRPSRAAALALLARADLMYAGKAVRPTTLAPGCNDIKIDWNIQDPEKRNELYKEVLESCDSIILKEGSFKLKGDFEQIFRDICADKTNYADMEHIWVIPFANAARGQVLNYHAPKFNAVRDKGVTYTMGILLHNKEYNDDVKSQGMLSMVPTLLFDYEVGDKRRDVTVWPFIWNVDKAKNPDPSLPSDEQNKICMYPKIQTDPSQWPCGKYRIEWMSRDNTNADDGIDFPIIRYSDVLLMYAEASIGSLDETPIAFNPQSGVNGQDAFDMVRNRAFAGSNPNPKPLSLEAIQEERKLEFAGEYIRKYDLMRWGILKEAMETAHERIEDLAEQHDGYKLYVKYQLDPSKSLLQPGAKDYAGNEVENLYLVEQLEFIPLTPGSGTGADASKTSAEGWINKGCNFESKLPSDTYILYNYDNPESLNTRQYWPIFSITLGASNGLLYNNYGY